MISPHHREHILSEVPGCAWFWMFMSVPTLLGRTTTSWQINLFRFSFRIQSKTEDSHVIAVLTDTLLISSEFFVNVHKPHFSSGSHSPYLFLLHGCYETLFNLLPPPCFSIIHEVVEGERDVINLYSCLSSVFCWMLMGRDKRYKMKKINK